MFGYIRPFKPHMRICEFDTYKAVYCGLCKEMGRHSGFLTRFTLSYDFAFLGLLSFAVNDVEPSIANQTCMAHPLKKTPCITCGDGLTYTAAAAVLSIYHKLRDDIADRGFLKKLAAGLLLPFIRGAYKKAKSAYPLLADVIEENMKKQTALEKDRCKSIDQATEPTAQIMAEIARGISADPKQQRVLARLGYLLGRYVYLADALQDAPEDFKKKSYNPLLLQEDCVDSGVLNMEKIRSLATDSIHFTLGELANTYTLLNIQKFKPILDNILYLGLKNTFTLVLNEKELPK